MGPGEPDGTSRIIGRYALHEVIAKGGMASVHLGRLLGLAGFARTVAVKRLHPNYSRDPEFVSMLIDEARLAARIRHPNVVATLDVVALEGELLLVMEYVHGESLSRLYTATRRAGGHVPLHVLLSIMAGVLYGLHAAHEAKNDRGEHIELVHRDVSPQNIQVGIDGVARVIDFGIAKAAGRLQDTREDQLKGRLRYMAPEQLIPLGRVDRRADIYSASAVLWQCLTGTALFTAENDWQMAHMIMEGVDRKPSSVNPRVPPELDDLVMRGLDREPGNRFPTAYEMAVAIEEVGPLATAREVGQWVEETAATALADRSARVEAAEGRGGTIPPPPNVRVSIADDTDSKGLRADPHPPPAPTADSPAQSPPVAPVAQRGNRPLWALFGAAILAVMAAAGASWALSPSPIRAQQALSQWSSGVAIRLVAPPPEPTADSPPTAFAPEVVSATVANPPVPAPPKQPRNPPPRVKTDCNPPYTFDADGVKHLKKECF